MTGIIPALTGQKWVRQGLAWLIAAGTVLPGFTQPSATRYNHATQLKLRAKPALEAQVLAQWQINQAMTLLGQRDKRWCDVASPDATQRGFVDCSYLGEAPLTLAQVEIDAAGAALALNRLLVAAGGEGYEQVFPKNLQPARDSLEKLLNFLERHFALSPSLYTYGDFSRLLQTLLNENPEGTEDKNRLALRSLALGRLGQLAAMRAALSQDFAAAAFDPVRHPIGNRLNLLLQQRRHGDVAASAKPRRDAGMELGVAMGIAEPAAKVSLFRETKWAAGWAGGALVRRMRSRDSQSVVYSVAFDGNGPWALADIYEMAKALRVPVKARFGLMEPQGNELSYAMPTAGTGVETLVLELRMPVWAITEHGLVAGSLRAASFGGDACAGDTKVGTRAEVVFPGPVKGDIHGIFASNALIDPARALVTVRKRTFLDPIYPNGDGTTFTHRVDMTVDIDGDGVADLRTVVSNDTSVSSMPHDGFMHAAGALSRGRIRHVAGWYANDIYMLQANEGGWWRTLSRYNLVTCT